MVKNPRTTTRPDQLRPLNTPRRITVVSENGLPVTVVSARGERQQIVKIEERWCIDDEWWREPIERRYYRVQLESGSLRTIYEDLVQETWHEQKY